MSQQQVGVAAGMDPFSAAPRINQYERGKHVPDFRTVERLAVVLDLPAPFFYTRDDLLAELIVHLERLPRGKRKALLSELRTHAGLK